MSGDEERDGVALTNLDQPLFDGAGATKRDLVDYLDAVADRIIPALRDRPLSVIRVRRGQEPFMQKNVPKYTPDWVHDGAAVGGELRREVSYALCNDRRTLLWFANQRAVEYHPTLVRIDDLCRPTHLVLDLDPPEGGAFALVVAAAELVRQALADAGLAGAVKTSGSKGVHIFVPIDGGAPRTWPRPRGRGGPGRARSTRASPPRRSSGRTAAGKVFLDSTRAGGATVAAAYSPRVRPGMPVSFPVAWSDLDRVQPGRLHRAHRAGAARGADPWARRCRRRSAQPPSWSRRAARSRSPGCRRCTRASAVPAPAAPARRMMVSPRPPTPGIGWPGKLR